MKVTVQEVKRYPHTRLIVRVNGKIDSIHYAAWLAYKRAEYLRQQASA